MMQHSTTHSDEAQCVTLHEASVDDVVHRTQWKPLYTVKQK
jgi:hypothetical protein